MRTVKAITGTSAAERFYKKLGGAIRYMMPAAAALAFMGMSIGLQAKAPVPSSPSTDITFTNLSVNENEAVGTAVGFMTAVDPDPETHTFDLVPGVGDEDNASFSILANKLQTNDVFNFEVKSSYSIRVSATGQDGLVYEKPVTVTIDDANDRPVVTLVEKSVLRNNTLSLSLADFEGAFTDEDGHALNSIEITSLPDYGVLRLNSTPLSIGSIISSSDCDFLRYDAPDTVAGFTSFSWKADDGIDFSTADGEYRIKVTRGREAAIHSSGDFATMVTLPSGTIIIGTLPDRPGAGSGGSDANGGSAGGATGGRRPLITSNPDGAFKTTDETTGVEQYEKYDLSVKAYPNPFASNVAINFTLSEESMVEVNVYNTMGALVKQVVNGIQPTGVNTVKVGDDLSNGSYIYTVKVLAADGQTTMLHNGSLIKLK